MTPAQRSKRQADRIANGLCLFCGTRVISLQQLREDLDNGSPAGHTCSACNDIHFCQADLDRAIDRLRRATTEAHVITHLKRLIRTTARNYHR